VIKTEHSADVWKEEGPAFTPLIQILATVLMLALIYWAIQSSSQIFSTKNPTVAIAMVLIAFAVCCIVYYWILKSRTSINEELIEQTWIWNKRVKLKDVNQVKLIFIPYLSWFIAPRLIIRSGIGMMVFHTAHPGVLAAFARMSLGRRPNDVEGDYD
jgi:amino acid transporter